MSSFGARTPHPGAPHVSRDLGSHRERPLRTVFLRDRATNYATLPPPLRKPAMGPQSPPVPQLWARLARFYSHIPSHTLAPNLAQVPNGGAIHERPHPPDPSHLVFTAWQFGQSAWRFRRDES